MQIDLLTQIILIWKKIYQLIFFLIILKSNVDNFLYKTWTILLTINTYFQSKIEIFSVMLLYKFLGVSFLFKRSTKTKTFSSSWSGSPKRLCFDLSFQNVCIFQHAILLLQVYQNRNFTKCFAFNSFFVNFFEYKNIFLRSNNVYIFSCFLITLLATNIFAELALCIYLL